MKTSKVISSIAIFAALLALLLDSASALAGLPDFQLIQAGPKNRVRAKVESAPSSMLADASHPLNPHRACDALAYDIASESLFATYVLGQGMDDVLAMNRGGSRYYYIRDAHGNVAALTDSSGDVIERYRYGEYGEVAFLDAGGVEKTVASSDYGNPLLFQARNFDSEYGLYYFRARYYSPALGRFLSHDPNGFADSMNLYQYCLENPINLTDPDGEIIPILIAGALIIGPAIAAELTQSDSVAQFSPVHNVFRAFSGEECFSRKKISDLERVFAFIDVITSFVPGAGKLITKPIGWALKGIKGGAGIVAVGAFRLSERAGGKARGKAGAGAIRKFAGEAAEEAIEEGGKIVPKRAVALDTNAIIARLEGSPENVQAVVNAMAGRNPRVSITAVKEFLRGGGDVNTLRSFLIETGGGVGKAPSQGLINQLTGLGLRPADAHVVGSAIEEGIPLLTRDRGILKKVPGVAGGF